MNRFSRVSPEWREAVFGQEELQVRVLVVADGDLTFIDFDDFGLDFFCNQLVEDALPWETITVETAHRRSDDTGAEIEEFRFDAVVEGTPRLSIGRYDQVWLFGFEGEDPTLAISESEKQVITEFMNNGGGVFATGDHEDLGAAMCSDVPRVRKMRRWHFKDLDRHETPAPSRKGPTRLDTLRAGLDAIFVGDDQKDIVPQEIRPKFFVNRVKGTAEPHELLATRTAAISILPDHMHEGECIGPKGPAWMDGDDSELESDFPLHRNTKQRVWPEVVAIASSAAGTFVPNSTIRPVDPRCFMVITAYDGHKVEYETDGKPIRRLGRVVVDASFHHFVFVNLIGFIREEKPELEIFGQYYRNILHYLLPHDKQRLYYLHLVRALRYRAPLLEEIQNLSPENWEHVIYAGAATNRAIEESFSPAHARRCALVLIADLEDTELRTELEEMLDLWNANTEAMDKYFFLNTEAVLNAILGFAILSLATVLPGSRFQVSRKVAAINAGVDSFATVVARNFQQQLAQLQKRFGLLEKQLERLSKI